MSVYSGASVACGWKTNFSYACALPFSRGPYWGFALPHGRFFVRGVYASGVGWADCATESQSLPVLCFHRSRRGSETHAGAVGCSYRMLSRFHRFGAGREVGTKTLRRNRSLRLVRPFLVEGSSDVAVGSARSRVCPSTAKTAGGERYRHHADNSRRAADTCGT